MSNQPKDDRTFAERAEEREQIKAEKLAHKENIKVGAAYEKLAAMPEFETVFKTLFYENGRKWLWENINHIEEELMKKARDQVELDRGEKNLKSLKRQVDGRLVFKSFCDTIVHDHNESLISLQELDDMEAQDAAEAGEA